MDQRADVPLDLLLPPDPPMRDEDDPQAFAELVADIKANGILQPLIVSPEGDHYRTIAGDRRRRAAIAAGLVTVPVTVKELDGLRRLATTARENLVRLDPHPLEAGRLFARMQDDHGLATEEIATLVHKSPSYVATRLRALRLPADVQDALRSGRINLTVALELGKVHEPADRDWLLHHAGTGGATAEVVRQWVSDVNYRRQLQQQSPESAPTVEHTAAPPALLGICDWHRGQVPLDRLLKVQVCADCYTELMQVRDEARRLDAAATGAGGNHAKAD